MSQLWLSYFNKNCIFYTDFKKFANNKFQENPPLRKKLLNADGQTQRGTNKMKLTFAYHYFADNLKNIVKI